MCARVALTACARSSFESISVPSRSKMSKSMLGLNSKRSANSPWVTGFSRKRYELFNCANVRRMWR